MFWLEVTNQVASWGAIVKQTNKKTHSANYSEGKQSLYHLNISTDNQLYLDSKLVRTSKSFILVTVLLNEFK